MVTPVTDGTAQNSSTVDSTAQAEASNWKVDSTSNTVEAAGGDSAKSGSATLAQGGGGGGGGIEAAAASST